MQRVPVGLILTLSAMLIAPAAFGGDSNTEAGPAMASGSRQAAMSGLSGEIRLVQDTYVGFRSLVPGRYRVREISAEEGHAIRFTPIGGDKLLHRPVIVECKMEPLTAPVKSTLVRLRVGTYHMELVKLYIEGESVVHVF